MTEAQISSAALTPPSFRGLKWFLVVVVIILLLQTAQLLWLEVKVLASTGGNVSTTTILPTTGGTGSASSALPDMVGGC